jgi:hypothetical protein
MSPADTPPVQAGHDRPAEPPAPLPEDDADESRPVRALGFVMTLIALVTVCWVALGALAVTGAVDVLTAVAIGVAGYALAAALVFIAARTP